MEEIKKLVDLKKSADFSKCVEIARKHYEDYFNHSIQNLLHIFPHDHLDKDGNQFWSGPKRAPTPQPFNPEDELHVHFVTACANLIAYNLGIPQNRDRHAVAHMAAKVEVADFKPKMIKIEVPGEKKENQPPV
jgi:ubiquitin-activating enzyme E1